MAGMLPKQSNQFFKIPGARIALLGSMWHAGCVDGMIGRARTELLGVGVLEQNIAEHHVPGSLELPYACRALFEYDNELDAILAFGVVLRGATSHADTVMQNVTEGFSLISDRFFKPIINEVIAVDSIEDALKRSNDSDGNKGLEAVFAVSEILHWKESLK